MTPGDNTTAPYSGRIIRDPEVCRGESMFKGTRVPCVRSWPAWQKGIRPGKSSPTSLRLQPMM